MNDPCVRCGAVAVHTHHRKLRSQGGDDSPANLLRLCLECHTWVHANPAEAYETGYLVHSWDDPATIEVLEMIATDYAVGGHEKFETATHTEPAPGTTCVLCRRRVPHPKKKESPQSKVVAYRVPLDDAETHQEIIAATARELGLDEGKYHKWQTISYALACVLQGARFEEHGG
jgi:hypothetical protein